jgi:UDP-N-acetylglucosamine--N-acetylmuramyl-(pentapeptide) pyrophosphoryl-undecaprenol N-acetylglucosamine transferase
MIAVGDAVRAADPTAKVVYVGTARGMEAQILAARGDDLELLPVAPLRGGGALGFAKGALRAARTLPLAASLVRRRRPDVVFSVGGYAAGPVALAARALGVPVTLLEPNSVVGLANRLLMPFVARAYTCFAEAERGVSQERVRREGVPLRRDFSPAPYRPEAGRFRVVVLGGSLGAAGLNAVAPEAFALLVDRVPHARILHQTGRGRDAEVAARYRESDRAAGRAEIVPFVDDVAVELASADVVLQRAGASSLAELCAVGRPSILVPYPFAAGQHQLANARALEAAGASVALPQAEASPERLADELARLADDPSRRARMAERARSLGRPGAAARIALDLLELAGRRGPRGEA